MDFVPPQAIAMARSTLGSLMTDRCIQHRPQTQRKGAATVPVFDVDGRDPVIATDVPCRVELIDQNPDGSPRLVDQERFEDVTHNVFFRYDQDVQAGDWIELAGDEDALQLVAVSNLQTDGYLLQAIAKEHG